MVCWGPVTAVAIRTGLTLRSTVGQHLAKPVVHLRRSPTIHALWMLVVLGGIVSGPLPATRVRVPVKRTVPAWVTLLVRVVEALIIVLLLLLRVLVPPI